ncbi:MAG TPA: hypothetical protein VF101_10040 [Gaiellaceae bacterium]
MTIRPVVTREVKITVGPIAVQVRGPDGKVRRPEPEPNPAWTPALRFFRYAQVSDDVFDAYRNAFLALEAILSECVSGGPGGERRWLAWALRELVRRGDLEMTNYVTKTSAADPVDAFLREQYEALRCSTFHAKSHNPVLLPGTVEANATVSSALDRLSQMVLRLVENVVGVRRLSGAMTYVGFEATYIAPKVGKLEMELERSGNVEENAEQVLLRCAYLGKTPDSPGEHAFSGTIPASELADSEFSAVRVTAAAGTGFFDAGPFDERFTFPPIAAAGADDFELLLVYGMSNAQQPKTRFAR